MRQKHPPYALGGDRQGLANLGAEGVLLRMAGVQHAEPVRFRRYRRRNQRTDFRKARTGVHVVRGLAHVGKIHGLAGFKDLPRDAGSPGEAGLPVAGEDVPGPLARAGGGNEHQAVQLLVMKHDGAVVRRHRVRHNAHHRQAQCVEVPRQRLLFVQLTNHREITQQPLIPHREFTQRACVNRPFPGALFA